MIDLLSDLYSIILSMNIVPDIFKRGVVVPIPKKSSLNPNKAENYRPITLSSPLSKLIELLIIPDDDANYNQFGFRNKRGTCSLLNDISIFLTIKEV